MFIWMFYEFDGDNSTRLQCLLVYTVFFPHSLVINCLLNPESCYLFITLCITLFYLCTWFVQLLFLFFLLLVFLSFVQGQELRKIVHFLQFFCYNCSATLSYKNKSLSLSLSLSQPATKFSQFFIAIFFILVYIFQINPWKIILDRC